MAAPSLTTEVAAAGKYPANRFNQRERKVLESVKAYVDSLSPDTVITTQGDIIVGDSGGDAVRLAKGTSGLPLVAGASTVSYAALSASGLASNAVTTAKILDANVTADKLASDAVITAKILDANVTADKLASDAVTTAKILDANVTLAKLAAGVAPSHVVKYASTFTTAGGDADESISVPGVLGTDIAIVTVKTAGGTPRSIVAAAAGTDAIAVVMSGDPSTDHVLQYMVLRAAV